MLLRAPGGSGSVVGSVDQNRVRVLERPHQGRRLVEVCVPHVRAAVLQRPGLPRFADSHGDLAGGQMIQQVSGDQSAELPVAAGDYDYCSLRGCDPSADTGTPAQNTAVPSAQLQQPRTANPQDRKSTCLNSSHANISY